MKILFTTLRFYPSYGGVQTVVRLYAEGLIGLGHEVRVITKEENPQPDRFSFQVIRKPSWTEFIRQFRWADSVVLHGISVAMSWPTLVVGRNVVGVHYMPEAPKESRRRLNEFIRRRIYSRCRHLSVSVGLQPAITQPYKVLLLPIDTDRFRIVPGVERDRDLYFIGRLVELKGVHDLLDAIEILNAAGKRYSLTITGDGPEQESVAKRISEKGLAGQITLTGSLPDEEVVRGMNRHKLILVPSRYHEPFGLVALEGIACGCVAIGTSGGGLPGAIGPCGVTVPNGNPQALAEAIDRLMQSPAELDRYRAAGSAHVAQHTPRAAAESLLQLIAGV